MRLLVFLVFEFMSKIRSYFACKIESAVGRGSNTKNSAAQKAPSAGCHMNYACTVAYAATACSSESSVIANRLNDDKIQKMYCDLLTDLVGGAVRYLVIS